MFKLQIEPWDQVKSFEISTIYATVRFNEEDDFLKFEHIEHGHWESVDYKFYIKKRDNYKQYLRMFAEVDIETIDLKNLTGTMSFFREVYNHIVSMYRRGIMADLAFRWRDNDILVEFSLYASRLKEESEILSKIKTAYGDEYLVMLHQEMSEDVESDLMTHTVNAVGLHLLFKEYVIQQQEASKI